MGALQTAPRKTPKPAVTKRNFIEAVIHMHGSLVPDAVWFHDALRPLDVKVYKVLMDHARQTVKRFKRKYMKDNFYPGVLKSQLTLADRAGCTDKTLRASLARLEEAGFIEQADRGFGNTHIIYMLGAPLGIKSEWEGLTEREHKATIAYELARQKRESGFEGSLKQYREWRDMGGLTEHEQEVMKLVAHYSMLARRRTGKTYYSAVSKKDPVNHKNFKKFDQLYTLCQEKGWNPLGYLEFIFDWSNAKWGIDPRTGVKRYPYPNQILSAKMQEFFEIELRIQDKKYQLSETKQRLKDNETRSIRQDIDIAIERSTRTVAEAVKRRTDIDPALAKVMYVYHHWDSLDPAYLYTLPWFREGLYLDLKAGYTGDMSDMRIERLVHVVETIKGSPYYSRHALMQAIRFDNMHGAPRNLTPAEIREASEARALN